MKEITVTVKYKDGLHARPAVKFIKLVSDMDSNITIDKDGTEYAAKSIVSILSACISCGQTITVRAEGRDEDESIAAIAAFFEES